MASRDAKDSTKKQPHSSSSPSRKRKSRWEPDPSTATKDIASSSAPKPPSKNHNASSDEKSTPKPDGNPNPNPNPSTSKHKRPKPHSTSTPRDPIPSHRNPFSMPEPKLLQPPPSSYGFHMLERRTLTLFDGSTHSYLALPPNYQDPIPPPRSLDRLTRFPPSGPDLVSTGRFLPHGPMSSEGFRGGGDHNYWSSLGLERHDAVLSEGFLKRKYGEVERDIQDEFAMQRNRLQYWSVGSSLEERNGYLVGNSGSFRREDEVNRSSKVTRVGDALDTMSDFNHSIKVDPASLKKAFLKFAKMLYENNHLRKNCLENGKYGPLSCIACERSSKEFADVHGLLMHAYNSEKADLHVDHLGLHRALCVVMGWNYMRPPDNSKTYQLLPADEAAANQDDLIIWPPTVMIRNTSTGKDKDGRVDGVGNKAMDRELRGLGFRSRKCKALYNKDGHLGVMLVRFAGDESGLKEAIRLAKYFEKEKRGREEWATVQPSSGKDEVVNSQLVEIDPITGAKKRIRYGHLFTAADLNLVDHETKKKAALESMREFLQPV